MKVPNLRKISLAIAGVFLLSLSFSQAGEVVINNFDDPTEATLWTWENWSDPAEVADDRILDTGGGTTPGSMRVTNNFPNRPGGYSQAVITMSLGAIFPCDGSELFEPRRERGYESLEGNIIQGGSAPQSEGFVERLGIAHYLHATRIRTAVSKA